MPHLNLKQKYRKAGPRIVQKVQREIVSSATLVDRKSSLSSTKIKATLEAIARVSPDLIFIWNNPGNTNAFQGGPCGGNSCGGGFNPGCGGGLGGDPDCGTLSDCPTQACSPATCTGEHTCGIQSCGVEACESDSCDAETCETDTCGTNTCGTNNCESETIVEGALFSRSSSSRPPNPFHTDAWVKIVENIAKSGADSLSTDDLTITVSRGGR